MTIQPQSHRTLVIYVAPKLRVFVAVSKAALIHNFVGSAILRIVLISEQHLHREPRGLVSTNTTGDMAACKARSKFFRFRHAEVGHEARDGERLVGRLILLRLQIIFEPRAP